MLVKTSRTEVHDAREIINWGVGGGAGWYLQDIAESISQNLKDNYDQFLLSGSSF